MRYVFLYLLIISQLGLSFATNADREDKTKEATNRIIYLVQEHPLRYGPQGLIKDLETLKTYTTDLIKQQVISDIQYYMSAYFACTTHNGQWISNYMECEWIQEHTCVDNLGGSFDACASACRHLDVAICTLECVPVCTV